MKPIRAFVGHSFTPDDAQVVGTILKYFNAISELHPTFSWQHAERAEPRLIDGKVLELLDDTDVFIGICTRKERTIDPSALAPLMFRRTRLGANEDLFKWKTSDWIIQEIGVAIGRGLPVVLFVEEGVRSPGGLQGNLEYIPFEREAPERAFPKLLEMLATLSPKGHATQDVVEEQRSSAPKQTDANTPLAHTWTTPKPEWKRIDFEIALIHFVLAGDTEQERRISEQYLASEEGGDDASRKSWSAFGEYSRIVFGRGGQLTRLEVFAEANPTSRDIADYLGRSYLHYEEFAKASAAFARAAAQTTDAEEEIRLLGEAACAAQKGGDDLSAMTLMASMRSRREQTGAAERKVVETEHELAEIQKEDDIQIAALERLLDMNPADNERRFALAYKYSELDNHQLAAFHYSRVPSSDR